MQKILLISGLCFFALHCACIFNAKSEGGQAVINVGGKVMGSDNTPAIGAEVFFFKKHFSLKDGDTIQGKSWHTIADPTGYFQFNFVDSGHYILKATSGNSSCGVDSVFIYPPKDFNLNLTTTLRLEAGGTIRGSFDSAFIDSALDTSRGGAYYVYDMLSNERSGIGGDGSFVVTNVPLGRHRLVMLRDSVVVASPLDTMKVKVISADTTFIRGIGAAPK
jgi:hypothetical protein